MLDLDGDGREAVRATHWYELAEWDVERPRHRIRLSPHFRHSFVTHASALFCMGTCPLEA